ncbi:hypothetical protein SAY86_000016 [Trapa natans]|uniref:Uncharacterized protein n=1 Tax=Trapa natans TaxID=22666 RepID=A0AAN7RMH0_TRANT|nr:hypothetical protein SAY86_000016 [Trapa natans]
MISLCLSCSQLPSSPSLKPSLRHFSPAFPDLGPLRLRPRILDKRRPRDGICRAELSHDAPFAVAIGASILSSLILPIPASSEEDGESAMDTTDTRFAVMGIISFIPYFNWLSWVFAWLDTGKRRYAVYALVYFAPYIRSNLSLSPEESWLPIISIALCVFHVQLEASLRNGDLQGFQLFNEPTRKRESHSEGHGGSSEEERKRVNLPSADERSRNKIRQWGVPRKPFQDQESLREGEDDHDLREL